MRMYTRPVDQGQIVEISYGYDSEGGAYSRAFDASDRTEAWAYGEIDWDREPEGVDQNRVPCVTGWEPCARPSALLEEN